MKAILLLITLSLCLVGCESYQQHATQRTDQLRKIYPAGMSRDEVQAKWDNRKPDFSATRPANGWNAYPNQYLAKAVNDREIETGKTITTVERHWGPDGWMSLCYCWYYYDSDSKLVDVEWEYKSD